jgi:murein DD-endopeptidase MepM/ murein hydrolase activator NlpD
MRVWLLALLALAAVAVLTLVLVDRRFVALARRGPFTPAPSRKPSLITVDIQRQLAHQILPLYVDAVVGDTIRVITRANGSIDMHVARVAVESATYSCPRTAVTLSANGRTYTARCGMDKCDRGGVEAIDIDGTRVAVEITRALFSRMKRGYSRFNAYRRFRLRGDVRLAIWRAEAGIMNGIDGTYVVNQPEWTRDRYGNWLHITSYGLHSATDIYATRHGEPEQVLSPVDGVVYKVYNVGASPDDRRRSKAVSIHGAATVGPNGERVLYRFLHLSRIVVDRGEEVHRGQVIGYTGHTGFDPSIGDHTHFEIRLNPSHFGLTPDDNVFASIPVNPYHYLLEWYAAARRRLQPKEDGDRVE